MFIDTHVHLTDKIYADNFDSVRLGYLNEGVGRVIVVGYNLQSSIDAKRLADAYEEVYFAVGVHPSDALFYNDETEALLEELASDKFDVMILNYANCDMVGHTGVMDAAVKAVKTVEECMDKIVSAILAKGGSALITADHGNADCMKEKDGSPFTAHTTNPVPFILVSEQFKDATLRDGGILADIAPTLLQVMGEEIPQEMSGKSLIK
jgi:phosphopentomutase